MEQTKASINELKRQWETDPIWDIEDTEGFEEYQEELREYRYLKEAEWMGLRRDKLLRKAEELGVSGNTRLARYILKLENRIEALERSQNAENN